MTNKEKLITIIGEENFEKLKKNFDGKFWGERGLDELINKHGHYTIKRSFLWRETSEGYNFWSYLDEKVKIEWKDVITRKISPEDHDLLFKMFVTEWMEYPQGDNERWYEIIFSEGVGLKIYEALRETN